MNQIYIRQSLIVTEVMPKINFHELVLMQRLSAVTFEYIEESFYTRSIDQQSGCRVLYGVALLYCGLCPNVSNRGNLKRSTSKTHFSSLEAYSVGFRKSIKEVSSSLKSEIRI